MEPDRRIVVIPIGGVHASKDPASLRTLVGSCVAVCLYDAQGRVGGMNHITFPGRADPSIMTGATRYAVNAIEVLINRIMALGGDRRRLVAKVFGGARIMPPLNTTDSPGGRNIQFVLGFMDTEGIKIARRDLGGYQGRKIHFHTDTGDAFVKKVASRFYAEIALEEERVLDMARKAARKPTNVTLF